MFEELELNRRWADERTFLLSGRDSSWSRDRVALCDEARADARYSEHPISESLLFTHNHAPYTYAPLIFGYKIIYNIFNI